MIGKGGAFFENGPQSHEGCIRLFQTQQPYEAAWVSAWINCPGVVENVYDDGFITFSCKGFLSRVAIRVSGIHYEKSRCHYYEVFKGFGEVVGLHFRMKRENKSWWYEGTAIVQYKSPVGAVAAINGLDRTGTYDTKGRQIRAEPHYEEFNLRAMDMVDYGASPEGPRVSISGTDRWFARRSNAWTRCPARGGGIQLGVKYDTS